MLPALVDLSAGQDRRWPFDYESVLSLHATIAAGVVQTGDDPQTEEYIRMGAWDVSIFGNDGAGDFLFEFDDAHTVGEVTPILEEALDAALGGGGVDSIDGEIGLAAAALVVAWRNPQMLDDEDTGDFSSWPRTTDSLPDRLAVKADQVLERMQQPQGNELFELWAEEDQAEEFVAAVGRWRSARS